jgi:hypothetical protein
MFEYLLGFASLEPRAGKAALSSWQPATVGALADDLDSAAG